MTKKFFNEIVVLVWLFVLMGCESIFEEQPANNPRAIFEDLWLTFQQEYAPFEERNVNWQEVYDKYSPMVSARTTEDELFFIFTQMLKTFDDGHVTLTTPGREIFISNEIRNELKDDELFSRTIVKTYLEPGYKVGEEEDYIYGRIRNSNIAYIYFDYIGDNLFVLHEFLDEFQHTEGYILDLRHNQGGDFTYGFSEMGRFVDQRRYVFRSKTKNGTGPVDYTDWHKWYVDPAGDYVDKPIIVLTDRYTISAAERTVMALMTLPNVTIVGDTTSGAHGTMIGRELANGWYYSLVPQKVQLFDGKSYEGIGLAPDLYSKNDLKEVKLGIDRTLETAVSLLK